MSRDIDLYIGVSEIAALNRGENVTVRVGISRVTMRPLHSVKGYASPSEAERTARSMEKLWQHVARAPARRSCRTPRSPTR